MATGAVTVNTTEEGDKDDDVYIVKDTNQNRKRCFYLSICALLLLAILITTITLSLMLSNDDPNEFLSDEESAAYTLDHLKKNSSDLDSFNHAFNVFDNDKDGYLNQTEFGNYFAIELSHSSTFPKIDVNNDSILSYPEVVTYVSQLSQIDSIFNTIFKEFVIPTMISQYNYEYVSNETVIDTLFNEYAAMVMYFDIYDLESNGYIRYDEYLSITIDNDFRFADINSDNQLDKDELFDLLYGDNIDEHHHSFSGVLHDIFHNDINTEQLFGKSLVDISITTKQVKNMDLNFCPLQLQSDHDGDHRRRLQYKECCLTLPILDTCREECFVEAFPVCFEVCEYFSFCCDCCP